MRNICFSAATSLDGFIAGPKGEHDWIVMDPEIDFMAMMSRFDTVLMGRKTFEASRAMQGSGGMPGVTSIVISSTLKPADYPEVTIWNDDLVKKLTALRKSPGKDIWLFGGGALLRSLIELKQVQRIELAIVPVLLGTGIPLLPGLDKYCKLKLLQAKTYQKTGTQSLEYEVKTK
jgi:dihydrofolate reductase